MGGMEANRVRQAHNPRVQRTIKATLKTLKAQPNWNVTPAPQ